MSGRTRGLGLAGAAIEPSEAATFDPSDVETTSPEERASNVRAKAETFVAKNPEVCTPHSVVDGAGYVAFCSANPLAWT
jgi:hypothetical protein